jgi:hypothetical protein
MFYSRKSKNYINNSWNLDFKSNTNVPNKVCDLNFRTPYRLIKIMIVYDYRRKYVIIVDMNGRFINNKKQTYIHDRGWNKKMESVVDRGRNY